MPCFEGTTLINVETMTLDDLIDASGGSARILMIDIEGHELAALRGQAALSGGRIKAIVFDDHAGEEFSRLQYARSLRLRNLLPGKALLGSTSLRTGSPGMTGITVVRLAKSACNAPAIPDWATNVGAEFRCLNACA